MGVKNGIYLSERGTKSGFVARRSVVCLLIALLSLGPLRSVAQYGDSLTISIVTCAPGDDMYTLFGHTAIRVREARATDSLRTGYTEVCDWIFNYGAFNFRSDRFVYRFLKGETDYVLAAEPSGMFFGDLGKEGRLGIEQVLNLNRSEKRRVFDFLKHNILPENRMYRYNWLYYNCTNRAKEVIENAVEGRVEYRAPGAPRSAREILGDYTKVNSWITFGLDLILGSEIDRLLDTRDARMFIPQVYQHELDSAVIVADDGSERPLVSEVLYPVSGRECGREDPVDQPLVLMIVMLAAAFAASALEMRRGRIFVWIDVSVVALIGLAGCLVAFLFFLSDHPGTSTNLWVIVFNPLVLGLIPLIVRRRRNTALLWGLSLLLLCQELALFLSGQHVNGAMHFLVCILFVRIMSWMITGKVSGIRK
ncbi:MAG: DUF4105 domain-containing protein [Bacteroidaceae bacterium]|nr:DUF4105 domain-containing protein [Bacteroidaceae bacterium]